MRPYFAVIASLAILSCALARAVTAQEEGISPILRCYQIARDQTLLDSTESQELCRGTTSVGPAYCYMAGDDETFLDTDDLIRLCRCADSTVPVSCYVEARTETDLWTHDALRICSTIFVRHLWADCTPREAY